MGSKKGKLIRFNEKEARAIGRVGRGVIGIRLSQDDEVVGMAVLRPSSTIISVTEKGYGKRTLTKDYRRQSRGGQGIISIKTDDRNGNVVGMKLINDEDEFMILSDKGKIIRIKASQVPITGRNTKGVRLIGLQADEKVVGIAKIEEKEEEKEENNI